MHSDMRGQDKKGTAWRSELIMVIEESSKEGAENVGGAVRLPSEAAKQNSQVCVTPTEGRYSEREKSFEDTAG